MFQSLAFPVNVLAWNAFLTQTLPLSLKEKAITTYTIACCNQSRYQWSCAFYLTLLDPCLNAIHSLDAVLAQRTLMLPNLPHNVMIPHVLPDRFTWPFIDFAVWLLAVTFTFDASYLGINRAERLKRLCKFELFWKKVTCTSFQRSTLPFPSTV